VDADMGFFIQREWGSKNKIDWITTTLLWFVYASIIFTVLVIGALIYECSQGNCGGKDKDTFYSQCQKYDAVVQCGTINEDELEGCKFRSVLVGKTMQRQCCKCIKEE
jgi:hypothetical protein